MCVVSVFNEYNLVRMYFRVEAHYNDGVDLVHQSSELQVHRLVVELEMGGNVRFEDGTIDDIW